MIDPNAMMHAFAGCDAQIENLQRALSEANAALRAECERLRKDVYASGDERERVLADLHNARLGYKDAP